MSAGPPAVPPAGGAIRPDVDERAAMLVLAILSAFGPLAIDLYLPALPAIGRDLGVSSAAVGVTLAAYFAGLSIGQLVVGPLSDRHGRARPLRGGLALFTVGSLLAAIAPSIELLIGARVLQALGGAACTVTVRAIVRDLRRGADAARMMSRLMLVMGVAPIVAPILGGAILELAGWRAIFAVLAAAGLATLAAAVLILPETAPPAAPSAGRLAALRLLARDGAYVRYTLATALTLAAVFAYVTAAPAVLIELHHLSSGWFAAAFGSNALGFVIGSQINARLVDRYGPARLFRAGLAVGVLAGATLLAAALAGAGLPLLLPPLWIAMTSLGFVMPNAAALALDGQGERAGLASAWMGAAQFAGGAAVSGLVSWLDDGTALPMAAALAACLALAGAVAPRAR